MTESADIICVYDEEEFSAPIRYTFDLLLSTFEVRYRVMPLRQFIEESGHSSDALLVSYGRDFIDLRGARQIHIYASDLFGAKYLKPGSLPERPLKKYDGLPVIYGGRGSFDWVRQSERLLETNIDVIASSFFMVSRYEEVVQDVKDEHDRFPAWASLASQEGFLDRPIVNEYIELLWNWIQALAPALKRRTLWPEGKDFAVCLTHDVDRLRKYDTKRALMSVASYALGKGDAKSCRAATLFLLTRRDPFDTFDRIVEMEQAYGFHSTFFFLARREDPRSPRYEIRKNAKLLAKLIASGCEIGLHGSYQGYDNHDNLTEEYDRLVKIVGPICGLRMHYLRFGIRQSVRATRELGITYDCSLGFPYDLGFRSGIAFPYHLYDFDEDDRSPVVEIPLILQEPALAKAVLSSETEAMDRVARVLGSIKKHRGCVSILWHSDYLDPGTHPDFAQLYADTLEYIHVNGGAGIACREIAHRLGRTVTA